MLNSVDQMTCIHYVITLESKLELICTYMYSSNSTVYMWKNKIKQNNECLQINLPPHWVFQFVPLPRLAFSVHVWDNSSCSLNQAYLFRTPVFDLLETDASISIVRLFDEARKVVNCVLVNWLQFIIKEAIGWWLNIAFKTFIYNNF